MNSFANFPERNCPICLNKTPAALKVSSKIRAENLDFASLTEPWRGFFKEKIFFSYYRCMNCRILFCPTYFSSEQLEALYSQMPDNTAEMPMAAIQKTQYSYFKTLRRYSPLTGALLEIGPDIGIFTEACAKEGAFETFWLYEPNKAVHQALADRVKDKEYHIKTEMFNYDDIDNHSVSTVVMIHVLDHLLEPQKVLREIKEKMANGGILAIVTHNENSLLPSFTRSRWPAYCLQHPQLFSPKSIRNLLTTCGFKTIGIHDTVNYFPAGYLLKHGLWATGMNKLGNEIPNTTNLIMPLKLGNMITIATLSEGK